MIRAMTMKREKVGVGGSEGEGRKDRIRCAPLLHPNPHMIQLLLLLLQSVCYYRQGLDWLLPPPPPPPPSSSCSLLQRSQKRREEKRADNAVHNATAGREGERKTRKGGRRMRLTSGRQQRGREMRMQPKMASVHVSPGLLRPSSPLSLLLYTFLVHLQLTSRTSSSFTRPFCVSSSSSSLSFVRY